MAKTQERATVIDTSGKQFQARRSWAQKHVERGDAYWDGPNLCRFRTADELAERRLGTRPAHRARLSVAPLRENEPTPGSSGAPWITYPFPEPRARTGSLRERFPDLARVGAGMR